jgi:hypothetical protein
MRSYPKCISPLLLPSSNSPAHLPWKELAAFRETALRHFTRPEDRAALEHVGSLLFEGARRDLLHTLHFLKRVGEARFHSTLPAPENVLAAILARTAKRILPEVERLRRDLERYHRAVHATN